MKFILFFLFLILTSNLNASHPIRDIYTQEDITFAKELWKEIEKIDFYKENALIYSGSAPHGPLKAVLEKEIFGYRTIIKKEYSEFDHNKEDIKKHQEKHLRTICVMIKKEGFDKKNKDWFWLRYKKDGQLDSISNIKMLGKFPACINCHKSASGKDYVFMNNKDAIDEESILKELKKIELRQKKFLSPF